MAGNEIRDPHDPRAPPWVQARMFKPGYYNEYGNYIEIPREQQWGEIMYQEDLRKEQEKEAEKIALMEALLSRNFGEKNAEIKAQLRRIYELHTQAKAAAQTRNIDDPEEGNFKTSVNGKIYRFTNRYWKKIDASAANYNAARAASAPERVVNPAVGDYKKIKGKVFRWTEEPAWLQVDRKTNYDLDLADTFARYNTLGKPYLNARDELWRIFYPDEPAIYRPKAYQRRNTRRSNRRRANRRNTRKY